MEYYSTININDILTGAKTWMNLKTLYIRWKKSDMKHDIYRKENPWWQEVD